MSKANSNCLRINMTFYIISKSNTYYMILHPTYIVACSTSAIKRNDALLHLKYAASLPMARHNILFIWESIEIPVWLSQEPREDDVPRYSSITGFYTTALSHFIRTLTCCYFLYKCYIIVHFK